VAQSPHAIQVFKTSYLAVQIPYPVDASPEYLLEIGALMMTDISWIFVPFTLYEGQYLFLLAVEVREDVFVPWIYDSHNY